MEKRKLLKIGDVVNLRGDLVGLEESISAVVKSVSKDEIFIQPENSGPSIDLCSLPEDCFPLPVQRYGKWGYVGKRGRIVLPFDYDLADFFERGRALVSRRRDDFFINEKGEWVDGFDANDSDGIPVYVLQTEGNLDKGEDDKVYGVFSLFEDAAGYLRQYRALYQELDSIMDEIQPAWFDQPNCYMDGRHYMTIRMRLVTNAERGSNIFCVNKTIRANVVDLPSQARFFSNKKDLLDYLDEDLGRGSIQGLAVLDEREAQVESESYTINVFVLQ